MLIIFIIYNIIYLYNIQNLNSRLSNVRSSKASDAELKELRAAFLADFKFLNYAWSEEAFRSAARLFLAKWSDKKYGNMFTAFLQHLQEHWLQPIRSRWYKGAAWGYVMNNGGLESQNKYFKLDATMYKKENTHKLVAETAGEWLANHAARRAAGAVNQVVPQFVFPVENITFIEWQRAYQYTPRRSQCLAFLNALLQIASRPWYYPVSARTHPTVL